MNLRYLTRQHESLTGMYVQAKLQFQSILDQVIRSNRNKKLRAYYDKKRAEGKLFKVAVKRSV